MVKEQLAGRGIRDRRVLKAMEIVPRHLFVDQAFWPRAYGDYPLPIACEQTISQPYIVALMTEELKPHGGEKILEIGTGSGYQAAVLAALGCTVYTVERHADLSKGAQSVLKRIGLKTVNFRTGDGSQGWPEEAPFDGIVVTAGAPNIPDILMSQLAIGGTLVIPVGNSNTQRMIVVHKGENLLEKRDICPCAFVPLLGEQGWEKG